MVFIKNLLKWQNFLFQKSQIQLETMYHRKVWKFPGIIFQKDEDDSIGVNNLYLECVKIYLQKRQLNPLINIWEC